MAPDWNDPSEEGGSNTNQDAFAWMNSYVDSYSEGTWEDYGIFERNTVTGETRLKDKPDLYGGLASDVLGHYERDDSGLFDYRPIVNFQIDEDNVLDNEELDRIGNDFNKSSGYDWLDLYVNAPTSGLLSTVVAPAFGVSAAAQDITGELYNKVGLETLRDKAWEVRDSLQETSGTVKNLAHDLMPATDTSHPVKDIWTDIKTGNPTELVKDTYGFLASTAAPMALIAGIEAASAGLATPAAAYIYGASAFDDTYTSVRYDDQGNFKNGAFTAAAVALPSAALQGALDTFSYNKIFGDLGSAPIKSLLSAGLTEGWTEGIQTITGDVFSIAPDVAKEYAFGPKEINWGTVAEWSANELSKAGWDAAGGLITGSAVHGVNHALNNAKTVDTKPKPTTSMGALNAYQDAAVRTDMGLLKTMLEAQGAGPENWQPEHINAIKAIDARWGHVLEVAEALKEVKYLATDPVAIGRRQAIADATPGGQDVEDTHSTPFESAMNAIVSDQRASQKVGALHTFVQAKKLFTTEEVELVSDSIASAPIQHLSPSEFELLQSSIRDMKAGTDTEENKIRLTQLENQLIADSMAAERASYPLVKAGFGKLIEQIQPDTPVGVIAGMVQAASKFVRDRHGKLVGYEGQRIITGVQDKIFAITEQMEDEDKVATPEYRAAISSIQQLNQFLSTDNVALSNQKYIEPVAVLVQAGKDVEMAVQNVTEQHDILESALTSIENMSKVEAKQQSALGMSPQKILDVASTALLTGDLSKVDPMIKDHVIALGTEIKSLAAQENPDMSAIVSRVASLKSAVDVSKNNSITHAVASTLSNYSKAATVHAAGGVEPEPTILNWLSMDGDESYAAQAKQIGAKVEALQAARKPVFKLLRYVHVKNSGDGSTLAKFLDGTSDEIAGSIDNPQVQAKDAYASEQEMNEAIDVLKHAIGAIYINNRDKNPGKYAEGIIATKDELNRYLVSIGALKSKKNVSRSKNAKTGEPEAPRNFLFEYAKAKGILVPTKTENGTELMLADGSRFIDKMTEIRAEFDKDTRDYAKGMVEWDPAVANALFNLLDNDTVERLVKVAKGEKDSKGGTALYRMAASLSHSFPRGVQFPDHVLAYNRHGNDQDPRLPLETSASLLDSQRALNVQRRLFNLLSINQKQSNPFSSQVKEVIRDITGLGKYSRGKYQSTKAIWYSLARELRNENKEKMANPTLELREGAVRDWVPGDTVDTEQWGDTQGTKGERWATDSNGAQLRDGNGQVIWLDPNDIETKHRKISGKNSLDLPKHSTFSQEVVDRDNANFERVMRTRYAQQLKELTDLEDMRRDTLLRFHNVTSAAGYKWALSSQQLAAIDRTITTGTIDADAKSALAYVEKVFQSVSLAAQNTSSPTGIAWAMAKAGYDAEEITLGVSLIVNMSRVWAKNTGKNLMEFYDMASHMVVGTKGAGVGKSFGTNIRSSAFRQLKKTWIALTNKLVANDRSDIFVPVHEFMHGMVASGQMANMFSESDRLKIEEWIGAKLPRVNPNTGTLWSHSDFTSDKEEKLLQAVMLSAATTDFTRAANSHAKRALVRVRDTMFDLLHDLYGKKRKNLSFTGVDILAVQNSVPDDVHSALVNIFGVNSATAAAYRISHNGVILTAANRLVGQVKSAIGLDISALVEQEFNRVDDLMPGGKDIGKTLRGLVRKQSTLDEFRKAVDGGVNTFIRFMGVDTKVAERNVIDHLAAIHREVKENEDIIRSYPDLSPKSRSTPEITKESVEEATDDLYVVNEFSDENGVVQKRRTSPVPRSEAAKAAKTVIGISTPLAFQDSTEITEPLARLLRTSGSPMLTGNPDLTSKNGKNIAVRALQVTMDMGKLFNSSTLGLEKYLLTKGLTREYLMVHNLGGLYSQARAALEDKVSVLKGPLGREKWTVIGESLRDIVETMPKSIQKDVWTYLSAKREIEIAATARRRQEQYQIAKEVWETRGGKGPKPKEPVIPKIDPLTLSAAVLFNVAAEAKYGKNAGVVGDFAKRIANFSNNAIAVKLHHYGMLSKAELGNLLKDGEWWIPQAYLKELTDDMDANDPFFNDGTASALKVLRSDRAGTEHPFEELTRRVVSTHILATKAFIRSGVIRSLVQGASKEDLAKIGVSRITTILPKRVSREDYYATEASMRLDNKVDPDTGEITYLIKEEADLDRRGYAKWAIEHPNEKKGAYAVWENGQASYYQIDDPQLRKAIDSLKITELHPFLKLVSKITSITARMITLAPKFILSMPVKDLAAAGSRSQSGINFLTAPYDLMNGLFHAMPIMFPSLGRRFPKTFWVNNERIHSMASQTSFQASFNAGGVSLNRATSKKKNVVGMMLDDLMSAYKESNETKLVKDAAVHTSAFNRLFGAVKLGIGGTIELLDRTASTSDAALRMAERKLARQGNISDISRLKSIVRRAKNDETWKAAAKEHDQPGYLSDLYVDALDRQLTLDFSRKGTAVRVISTMKTFAGPMFQDSATTMDRLGNPITRKAFIFKSLMAFTLPALANWARWQDDDDYQRLSYWDKLNFYQIDKNTDGTFNQIPTGIGVASVLFKDTFITMAQIISDKDPVAGKEWLSQLIEQTPLQFQPIGQDVRDWMTHLAPTALEPTAEVAMNWNPLSNSPIDYDKGKQNAPLPEDRGVEKFGVAERILASWLDTSPRVTGYWLRQSMPGMGGAIYGMANEAATAGYIAAGGDPTVGKQYNPVGTYLWKYWSGQVYGPASLPVNRLYDIYESSANANASITQAENNGSYDKAMLLRKKHPEWAYHDMLKQYYGKIQRMKIERGMYLKTVDPNDPMVKVSLSENFDKPMTLLAEEANRTYYNILKNSYNR